MNAGGIAQPGPLAERPTDPGYVRELLAAMRELVDALQAARPYVSNTRPGAKASLVLAGDERAEYVLDQIDGALADAQAHL